MLSKSAPDLKYVPRDVAGSFPTSTRVEDNVHNHSRSRPYQVIGTKKQPSSKSQASGYSFTRNARNDNNVLLTIDPEIFFGKVNTCLHRPHRKINWEETKQKPLAVPQSRTTPVGPKLPKLSQKPPPVHTEVDSKAEKELEVMQERFDAQRVEYKTTLSQLKSVHKEKTTALEKDHERKVMLLEHTHSHLIQRMQESHSKELNEMESRYMKETTELNSQLSMLGVKIQKMAFEYQKKLGDQYLKMESECAERLEEHKKIAHAQFEVDFQERLSVRTNELISIYKKELLDQKQSHEEQIEALRRKFTRPTLLIEELEISQKTIASLTEELKEVREKLNRTREELRMTEVQLSATNEDLKKHQLLFQESCLDKEQIHRERLDGLIEENRQMRQIMLSHQEKISKMKVQEQMRESQTRYSIKELLILERNKSH